MLSILDLDMHRVNNNTLDTMVQYLPTVPNLKVQAVGEHVAYCEAVVQHGTLQTSHNTCLNG
jgi:hypothetical protein